MASEIAEAVAAMILERQTARAADHTAHTTALTRIRRTLAERRAAGLKQRHAAKLARSRKPGMLT